MSLLAEHIPENDRAGFASKIVDVKLLGSLEHFRIVRARLAQAGEVAFNVGHEYRHTTRAKIFGERLQRDSFSSPSGACNQAVPVRHLRKQKNWLLRLPDEDGFGHDEEL